MAKKRPKKKRGGVPPPACKALLLCDQTIIEAGSGKVSVIGAFTNFTLRQFPGFTSPFTAFMQLADGIGRYQIRAEIHDLREDVVLARTQEIPIEFAERLTRISICLPVPPMQLSHPGNYDFVFFANGREIDRQQFSAILYEDQGDA